mmetsp:Transcript_27573/g.27259  ORF Transcript_27573/g.27259 Transcript_27573/m.27259 type:complete len:544 (-) Transcript_27573:52-1683(-)
MGSSGAGKTTLLNIVAGRISSFHNSHVAGSVKANGTNISSIKFDQFSTYITQEDILLPTLTIRECFEFSARMKLKGTNQEIMEKVEKTIADLKLEKAADNVIGSVLNKGISGGERKRTCIGVELITDPAVIILDEPTSGLDSFTAETLVDLLIEQINKGKTVIATIHQPSSNVFKKFSKLILLCEGYTVYQGPPTDSRKYFSNLGYKCPRHVNPADFYMRLLHVVNRFDKSPEEQEKVDHLADSYKESEDKGIPTPKYELTELKHKAIHNLNFFKKVGLLWKRSMKNAVRNPFLSRVRIAQFIIVSAIIDLVFHDLGNDFDSIQNTTGVLFFMTLGNIMLGNNPSALTFPAERPTFLKEHNEGLYSTFIYFIAKNLSELPMQFVVTMIYSLMVYFALDLNLTASRFFTFYAILTIAHMAGVGSGYIIGGLCETENVAALFGPIIPTSLIVFGGSFGNLKNMNAAFSWLQYISPFGWCFKSLVVNQYEDFNFDCDPDGPKCDPLDTLGFNDPLWKDIICLIALMIAFRLIAFICLSMISRKKKH